MGRGRITRGEKKNIKSDSEDEGADRSKREKNMYALLVTVKIKYLFFKLVYMFCSFP